MSFKVILACFSLFCVSLCLLLGHFWFVMGHFDSIWVAVSQVRSSIMLFWLFWGSFVLLWLVWVSLVLLFSGFDLF